jgi:hypothetical protein
MDKVTIEETANMALFLKTKDLSRNGCINNMSKYAEGILLKVPRPRNRRYRLMFLIFSVLKYSKACQSANKIKDNEKVSGIIFRE